MIKNIIFDFGNIIINFDAKKLISKFTKKEEEQKFLIDNVINSPEWIGYGLLDSGYISYEQAISLINDRTNNKYEQLVNNFMNNYYKYMNFNGDIVDVLKELKNKGYKLYMLSNTSELIYTNLISKIEPLFDGLVLSYQIHMIKPYDSIYEYLLNKYNINPEESLFIDDRGVNIKSANKFGIKGRSIIPDNIEDIKLVLKEYKIL